VVRTISDKPLPIDEKYLETHPQWADQFMGVFRGALIAMFLEDSVSNLEAKSFLQMVQKNEGLTALPSVISLFRRYVEDYRLAKYKSFAEYLPNFAKHLRVAKTLSGR
jgi:hypothetical protein